MNPKGFNLRSKDNAREALMEVVRRQPNRCNPRMVEEDGIITELLALCGQPDQTLGRDMAFMQYWEALPIEHRHRIAIPMDVAYWMGRVQAVFNSPMDFDRPGKGRVQWKEGLRRCKSQLLL